MEYVLQTAALKKSYGRYQALNGLTMNVPKGSIYGFVGKNGAGKTTLIRLICGLQTPSAGEYSIYGIPGQSKEIVKARRRMGAVVETPSVYLDMTAEENMKMQYSLLGLPSFTGIGDILDLVGLQNTGRKKVKNFSLGMRQRLGIAVAMAGSPDFLALDEPVNGLDPQGIVEVREIILKLNRAFGITVLISSHILDELSRLATYFGFIDHGQMVKEISAGEMEAACRKRTRLTVSDVKALSRVMEAMGMEYTILSEHEAELFGKIGVTELVSRLCAEGCEVSSLHEQDESLENYYINLVGESDMEIIKLLYANKLRLKGRKLLEAGFIISMGYSLLLLIMNYIELRGHIGDSIVAITWYLLSPFSTVSAFCPVFCSLFIGSDFSYHTIRNKLIAGHTRGNIYLANFITVSAVHIALLLVTDMITAILATLMFGWHMLYPSLFLLHFFSGILMLIALSSLFTLIAMLIHNQTYSSIWGLLIFIVLFSAETSIQRIIYARLDGQAEMVTTGIFSQRVLEFIYDFIPIGQLLQVSRGMILHSVRVPVFAVIFTVLTTVCGIAVFRKKDFK